jgi:ArsR family transcriptional regulator, arsenate/arsenite/antimonite-responsive transcriptional repressor
MKTESFLLESETFFMALADKTRLRLLNLIRDEEICVCFFVDVLGESQPKISRHLAYLRNAGIVEARRDGKWMHYRIIEPQNTMNAKILGDVLEGLKDQENMRSDYDKLISACCSSSLPVSIIGLISSKIDLQAKIKLQETPSESRGELETFLL